MSKRKQVKPKPKMPGDIWRLSCILPPTKQKGKKVHLRFAPENIGKFDELVVDGWFHIEKMNDFDWWMRVGGVPFWIKVSKDGKMAEISLQNSGKVLK